MLEFWRCEQLNVVIDGRLTILTAVVVFVVSSWVSQILPQPLRTAHPWLSQAVLKPLLIAISLGLMYAMRRPLAEFGFRPATRKSKRWIALGVALAHVGFNVGGLIGGIVVVVTRKLLAR